ncbi:MAG: hypothetical protein OSW77_16130 [Proteobacteria bacterium]|nr:hypothetical protein [Pseudomonadota bacterium]
MASRPLPAVSTCQPNGAAMAASTARAVALSSTISTRRGRAPPSTTVFRASARGTVSRAKSTAKWKQLPCPGTLSTASSPPISRTSRRLIASPSPVPP